MKLRAWLVGGVVLLALFFIVSLTLAGQRHNSPELIGSDVSWPNCQDPATFTSWGIVGVTGGLDFTTNKCLRTETAEFPSLALYMNTGWPGSNFYLKFYNSPKYCSKANNVCLAYNYGFHAASYAIDFAHRQLVSATSWWLDVETDNSWTTSFTQNQAALDGMIAAVKQENLWAKVGFYASPEQWSELVGNWRPNLPAWLATGATTYGAAKAACFIPSFTDKPIVMTQYTPKLDQDLRCSS
ncbi:MAG TPA: hypothetical protein VMR95_00090 [Candidatus Binatia bacterium]|nr:hypothetical protein [Candidatus Binatia bacterium]